MGKVLRGLELGRGAELGCGLRSVSMNTEKLQLKGRVRIWCLVGTGAGLRVGIRSVLSIQVGG